MDCLRSFSFRVNTNTNLSGANISQWTTGVNQHFWSIITPSSSRYNIQGFKNINVFGIDVVGDITTLPTSLTGKVIVNNWSLNVNLFGLPPIVGGNINPAPNFYGLNSTTPTNSTFPISKFSNSLKLCSPIESVQYIQLESTYAQGIGYETLGDINIFWNLNFIVYYRFEGE